MASRPDHMSSKSRPIPLALPTALLSKLDKTAALMNRTRAQLIRDTIEIGLEDLRRCGYNIAAAVVSTVCRVSRAACRTARGRSARRVSTGRAAAACRVGSRLATRPARSIRRDGGM